MERRSRKKRSNEKDTAEDAPLSKVANNDDTACNANGTTSPYFDSENINSGAIEMSGLSSARLGLTFFNAPCKELARNLLGQCVVRDLGSHGRMKAKIVETEAYLGPIDRAAHSYQGKRTPRNEAMFMDPGTSYVYNIYGMYCCLNISSKGDGSAVLLRALEPLEGQILMREGRASSKKSDNKNIGNKTKALKQKDLCNGPSKLCMSLHITKNEFNQKDMNTSDSLWLESGTSVASDSIVSCARINIGYAEDWKDKPLRFYILGNSCVSVRDKKVEQEINSKLSVTTPATSNG